MKQGFRGTKAIAILLTAIFVFSNFSQAGASAKLSCYRAAPKPWVCLTVDDGCSTACIRSTLNALKISNVKCTFFVIGCYMMQRDKQPLWRQAVRDGHEICYHSMNHMQSVFMTDKQIKADIDKWEKTARQVLGPDYKIPKFARLPGGSGSFDQRVLRAFASKGYTVIRWNADTLTGAINRGISIKNYIRNNTRQGSIILTHFSGPDTRALPGYIGWLKTKFKLARISDAFAPPKPKSTPSPTPNSTPAPSPGLNTVPESTAAPVLGTTAAPAAPPVDSLPIN